MVDQVQMCKIILWGISTRKNLYIQSCGIRPSKADVIRWPCRDTVAHAAMPTVSSQVNILFQVTGASPWLGPSCGTGLVGWRGVVPPPLHGAFCCHPTELGWNFLVLNCLSCYVCHLSVSQFSVTFLKRYFLQGVSDLFVTVWLQ